MLPLALSLHQSVTILRSEGSEADVSQSDTIRLIASSIKDIVFSQDSPENKLQVPPSVPANMSNKAVISSTDDGHPNGVNGNESGFESDFTNSVINAVGPKANPRLAKVMNDLTRHLHEWMRENEITLDEYMAGIDLVSRQNVFVINPDVTM